MRGLLLGLYDLANPWALALALGPGKGTITLRFDGPPAPEAFAIPPAERRAFVSALADTILGRRLRASAVGSRASTGADGGGPEGASDLPAWTPVLEHFMTGPYGWEDCPLTIRREVEGLVQDVRAVLGANLVGFYLHGSLAMRCFNPRWSDIDVLGITREFLNAEETRSVAEALLRHSRPPRGVEAMFVPESSLRPWRYPTPYSFYFSERRRARYEAGLRAATWRTWAAERPVSYDLAANLPRIRVRGVRLAGRPIPETVPRVPSEDYVTSILRDFDSKRARLPAAAVSGVLNACRNYSFLRDRRLDSKEEAAVRALQILPKEDRRIVRKVLDVYRGHRSQGETFDETELACFYARMDDRLGELRSRLR